MLWAGLAIVLENFVVWLTGSAVQTILKKAAALAALTLLFSAVQQYVITPYVWPAIPLEAQEVMYMLGVDVIWPIFMAYVCNAFVLRAWLRALTA